MVGYFYALQHKAKYINRTDANDKSGFLIRLISPM